MVSVVRILCAHVYALKVKVKNCSEFWSEWETQDWTSDWNHHVVWHYTKRSFKCARHKIKRRIKSCVLLSASRTTTFRSYCLLHNASNGNPAPMRNTPLSVGGPVHLLDLPPGYLLNEHVLPIQNNFFLLSVPPCSTSLLLTCVDKWLQKLHCLLCLILFTVHCPSVLW